MAYRLPGGRSELTVGNLTIEVEDIGAWPVYHTAVGLAVAYYAAKGPAADFDALHAVYTFFCAEAQPTWQVIDHRGVIPPTPAGMLRFPVQLGLEIVSDWAERFVAEPAETAVDKLVPEGPLRDRLNAQLRAVA